MRWLLLLALLVSLPAEARKKPPYPNKGGPNPPLVRTADELRACRYPIGKVLCLSIWEGRKPRG